MQTFLTRSVFLHSRHWRNVLEKPAVGPGVPPSLPAQLGAPLADLGMPTEQEPSPRSPWALRTQEHWAPGNRSAGCPCVDMCPVVENVCWHSTWFAESNRVLTMLVTCGTRRNEGIGDTGLLPSAVVAVVSTPSVGLQSPSRCSVRPGGAPGASHHLRRPSPPKPNGA